MATKTKSKPKAKPVEEDLELDEVEGDDVEEEASSKSSIEFGVADLAKHLEKITGKTYKTRDLRTLIRKMAREDNARVQREIVAGNKSRYDWPGGLEHPEVKKIIAAVKAGEVEAGKKAALDALKEKKAKEGATAKKGKKGKKAAAPVVEDEDEDLEDIEDEDDDE